MWKCFRRYDGRSNRLRRAARAGVALVTSAIAMMACGTDHPTSPSGPPVSTNSIGSALAETSPLGDAASPSAHTASAAQTTAAPGTPSNFRIVNRFGSRLLDLTWEAPSGWSSEPGYHFELSYAGKTVQLSYITSHRQDVSDLDFSPGHSYTFSLRAVDPANQASAPAQLVFETTPPDPPTNLQQLSTVRLQSGEYPDQISFSPGRDNSGAVRRYEILLDGRLLDNFGLSGGTTQFSLYRHVFDSYTSVPCGPTALQLRSEDSSFNVGPPSATLTVFFPNYENCPPPHRD